MSTFNGPIEYPEPKKIYLVAHPLSSHPVFQEEKPEALRLAGQMDRANSGLTGAEPSKVWELWAVEIERE